MDKNSYETSWADQWDPNVAFDSSRKTGGSGKPGGGGAKAKYGKKMEEGLVKTKDVAVVGMKKVKVGATVGFNWIKDNDYQVLGPHNINRRLIMANDQGHCGMETMPAILSQMTLFE
ncbi:hypothetical protein AKJ16_DCAP16355, partial [Drosera capensis]